MMCDKIFLSTAMLLFRRIKPEKRAARKQRGAGADSRGRGLGNACYHFPMAQLIATALSAEAIRRHLSQTSCRRNAQPRFGFALRAIPPGNPGCHVSLVVCGLLRREAVNADAARLAIYDDDDQLAAVKLPWQPEMMMKR